MKRTFLVLTHFFMLTCVLLIATTIHAATLEVGSGKPYTTIQSAINAANPGDTVLVYDGTYVENINFSGKAITVKSVNGAASTIIDGNASGSVVTFSSSEGSGSVLDGFTIRNGNGTYIAVIGRTYGGGIYCYYSSPIITNCTITGNTSWCTGGIICWFSSPTIANCTIAKNTAVYAGGIGCGVNPSSPTITNCTITGNTASSDGGGIYCDSASPTITNCTITGNTASNGGGIYCFDSSPTVKNSILWGDTAPNGKEIWHAAGGPTVTYSDIEGGWTGTGNINADPLFVGSGDYHLTAGSPCIDAATSDNAPTTDMEGNPRYDDPSVPNTGGGTYPYYDMGAFEYQMTNVIIGDCDSGVRNLMLEDGSTMNDMINACANGVKNHGAFVSCVAKLTNTWEKMELITEEQKEAIQSCAAKASIP